MLGKITDTGYLEIYRGRAFKGQGCPKTQDAKDCGDWCPLFGEPVKVTGPGTTASKLRICDSTILDFHTLEDN